jgi:serine/threonine-protein kinase RsbW
MQLHVRVPADARAPGSARRALTELRPALGDDVVEPATLLVSELVTNSVRHADVGDDDVIDVRIEATERRLRVEVDDPGPGFCWPRTRRDPASEGGFGMVLVRELASGWGVEPGVPTRVWFQLDVRRPPRHGAEGEGLVAGHRG